MSAGLFGIAGGEQDVTDTLKDTRIGFFCKIEDDRIAIDNGISAIRVVIGHRNVASDLRKLIDHCIITPIFDASDIVVLLSNLLDNAIEACQQYDKGDKAIHVMAVAQQDFFVSVRNTSEPVVIINGSIPTTKPEPQMHGFGLANIRLILEKYSGEYTMFYENGWFQFTADIPLTPIS